MAFLEDEIPCIRLIYEFDPTYYERFTHLILDRVAEIYEIGERSYYLFPVGIFEKFEDHFLLLRICLKKPFDWDPCSDFNKVVPYSMMLQYFQSKEEWKAEVNKIKSKTSALNRFVTRKQFQKLYNFEFRLNAGTGG